MIHINMFSVSAFIFHVSVLHINNICICICILNLYDTYQHVQSYTLREVDIFAFMFVFHTSEIHISKISVYTERNRFMITFKLKGIWNVRLWVYLIQKRLYFDLYPFDAFLSLCLWCIFISMSLMYFHLYALEGI